MGRVWIGLALHPVVLSAIAGLRRDPYVIGIIPVGQYSRLARVFVKGLGVTLSTKLAGFRGFDDWPRVQDV